MLQNSSLPWSDQNNWVYTCMCGGMYRLNPLKSCVRAKWIMNCLEYPSILLQMDYVYHMHHMKCSAFSDSVWRQTDVGRTVLHTNDVRIMPWSVFLATKSQTLYKLKCLVMKRDSLSAAILRSLPQQWQLVSVMISVWPRGLSIHHQRQTTTQGNQSYAH